VLEDFLDDWPGALVVVSHDRALLERTVTDVVVIDEDTDGRRLPGGYAAWEEARRARRTSGRTGAAAPAPAPTPAPSRPVAAKAPGKRSPAHLHKLVKEAEGAIRRLERRREEITAELAEGTADHVRMAELGRQLAATEDELAEAEDAWLELTTEAER
jgi:ATP-binding cassette subfamily F protein uup